MKFQRGDRVKVKRCHGVARVVKFLRKYGVYLLDRQMSVCFPGDDTSVTHYVSYWTFAPEVLEAA